MRLRFVPVMLILQLSVSSATVSAQATPTSAPRYVALPREFRTIDPRLIDTKEPGGPLVRYSWPLLRAPQAKETHRTRNAIIGGVIGSAVGIGTCTALATIMNDSANPGVRACTATGNVLFGIGGFAVGALIGAAVR